MKNFDTRVYSVNDFIEWERNGQLELSPKFQRRSVWSDTARSYLMDTIISGKPMPKVFIRQKLNPTTKKSIREVVDGQQRLRTILSYMKDGFQISKKHNEKFGGLYYSQLDRVDEDTQSNLLNYEISVDLLVNITDEEVLDIFGRLNSYSVTLNVQEKINANHFGPFKILADKIAYKYNKFWVSNKVLSEQKVLRMEDSYLVSDLLIAMKEGIQTKKKIGFYYNKYENDFVDDTIELECKFDEVMLLIQKMFTDTLKLSNFNRIHLFYTLFVTIYHLQFGLNNMNIIKRKIKDDEIARVKIIFEKIDEIFSTDDIRNLSKAESKFLEDSRRATTDTSVRIRRTEFILKLLDEQWN